ncbi:MAG: S8 family peptidase [Bacteroidia bacterium]
MKKNALLLISILFLKISGFAQTNNGIANTSSSITKFSPGWERAIAKIAPSQSCIFLVQAKNWSELQNKLQEMRPEVRLLSSYPETATVLIETSKAHAILISTWPGITFMDIRNRTPEGELSVSDFDLSVNEVDYLSSQFPDLDGSGMVFNLKESRYDSTDVDLAGRYIPTAQSTAFINVHATTIASMIAGAGNSYYTGKGVAPAAMHTSASFYNLLPEPRAYYDNYGISVQNHSYGIGVESYYGAEAAAYDHMIYHDGRLIHVFSAGNAGLSEAEEGPYAGLQGFANLTGNFKMAKNLLTVGSVDSFLTMETLSSHGPAHDGRVKPELVAYGEGGSSGAAGITSGVSLLIQQAYKQSHDSLPAAELVKAALLNGAQDLLTTGPDFISGFGNVQAFQSVKSIREGHYFLGYVAANESIVIPLEVPSNIKNLKLTLCWLVPPHPNISVALVNDLDMQLILPGSGNVWLPWTLNTSPHPDSLLLPAVRKRDTLNPQEQISLADPLAGNYQIEIKGQRISTDRQRFALVYDWDIKDYFYWTRPTSSDNLHSENNNVIRWKNSYGYSEGKIEYRFPGQSSDWAAVADSVRLHAEYHTWKVPDIFATAQLRMIIASDTFYADTFTISRPLDLALQFDCEDSLLLSWEKMDGIDSYQLWAFTNNELNKLVQTSDSFAVLPAFASQERLVSVQPVLAEGITGLRSPLLNLNFQNSRCYLQSFWAREADNQGELTLELGSVYSVSKIRIEKRSGSSVITLAEFPFPAELSYTYLDANLNQGANNYRAVVELQSGLTIMSDEQRLIYAAPATALIYPNPAYDGEDVTIQTKNLEGSTLYLYDQMARLIEILSIDVETEFLFTDTLSRGIYFYQMG